MKHPDVFVIERYYDTGAGTVIGAFRSLAAAKLFCDRTIITGCAVHKFEITLRAPLPLATWRRFADGGHWLTDAWEHRSLGEGSLHGAGAVDERS